ncbi:MAG: decaprenyl-phosphate phosphoribosyltransferase [Fibrobacterota bacterium]|nr:decaprenyl-phosphate phosphoribosyltransferase [Fibrobacterota bacterium]
MSRKPWVALLSLARPSHWIKNVFVLAGVFFAEDWNDPERLFAALAAFLAFCLAASGVYCINDVLDLKEDSAHPRKRQRPLAAGEVSPNAAYALAAALGAAALTVSLYAGPRLSLCLAVYAGINILYSRTLKHMVLVDVFCIASGFIIRLLAGTWGIGVEPSQWFLLCTLNLSLFLGFSKRYAELIDSQRPLEEKRIVLKSYSPEFLRSLLAITLSATLITYGLYTTSERTLEVHGSARLIYTLPIAMFGLFRYLYLVMEKGYGENTVADVRKDPALLLVCALYIGACAILLGF